MKPLCNRHAAFVALLVCMAPMGAAETIPFSDDAWTIDAQEQRLERVGDREALYLRGGTATLEEVTFRNGTLEFDVMVTGEASFSGGRWRIRSGGNFEDFYIRPHQSGNADANQYQPVFNSVSGWQIYFGTDYSVPVDYPLEQWIPVRIAVRDTRAQIDIGKERTRLVVRELVHGDTSGAIGVASGGAGVYFANFRYRIDDEVEIAPDPVREQTQDSVPGLVRHWMVSDAVAESRISGITRLDRALVAGLKWQALQVETNGIANLARIQSNRDGANTAFARLVLYASEPIVQPVQFGFSDRVRAFVNGTLVYSGADKWRSRDYRFLGTVGFHDTIYCPLQSGRNEIVYAVSEDFGGWAVSAIVDPVAGVRVGEN